MGIWWTQLLARLHNRRVSVPCDYVTDLSEAFAVGRSSKLIGSISSRYSDPEGQSRDRPMTSPVTGGWFVSSD